MDLKNTVSFITLSFFVAFSLHGKVHIDSLHGKANIDSLLHVLDKTIREEQAYDEQKEYKLFVLKDELTKCKTQESLHDVYINLFREYEAFIYDSALYYVRKHLEISEATQNIRCINDCKMQIARMYAVFTSFFEAQDILNTIDKSGLNPEQLGEYYNSFSEIYTYQSAYCSNDEILKYSVLRDVYKDSALMVITKGDYSYDINYGSRCIHLQRLDEAEKTLLPYLSQKEPDTRVYAILTSIIASLYEQKGQQHLQKEFLIRSAIADIRASVKEHTSLSQLAYLLLHEGDVNRANSYIKKSMEDANFFNARLRNVQVSKILPIIDTAFQKDREKYQQKLQLTIIIIIVLSFILAGIIIFLFMQIKRLAAARREVIRANNEVVQANQTLKEINSRLKETNHIKETYLGRFLHQCLEYIDKMEAYRKMLNKKATSKHIDELLELLKSSQFIQTELNAFYRDFDQTFLNLFPDFVDRFNELLAEEDRIIPKQEKSLTAELRIFALIRLGITDSADIADFLRYSITTIYNYRSKFRKKSLVPNGIFEDKIMKIGELY